MGDELAFVGQRIIEREKPKSKTNRNDKTKFHLWNATATPSRMLPDGGKFLLLHYLLNVIFPGLKEPNID